MSSSALLDRILGDVKEAMKAKDHVKLDALRTLHSDIKNIAINSRTEISDETCVDAISRSLKQKGDAIEQFRKAGREDLVEEETLKSNYMRVYLPEPLSEAELEEIVKAAIAETGATSRKDMGAVMKAVGPKTKGRADGRAVSGMVQKLLG